MAKMMLVALLFVFVGFLVPTLALDAELDTLLNASVRIDIPIAARIFKPVELKNVGLQKAAESLRDNQCGGVSLLHREIAMCNTSFPEAYVIPHAAIRHSGEECGTGRRDEYTILFEGAKMLSAQDAARNNLGAFYEVLSANARAANALAVLNDLDPIYVGFDYNTARICGGREVYPRYTVYFFINVSPGNRDLNFRFAYLGTQELGVVTIRPDEELCLFKETRNLGPGQSPFATPTPSVSPLTAAQTPLPYSIYDLDDTPLTAPCFPVFRLDPDGSPLPRPSLSTRPSPVPSGAISSTAPSPSGSGSQPNMSTGASSSPSPASSTGPSPSKSSQSPSSSSNTSETCFPSSSKVRLDTGKVITISELTIGDKVLVADGKYSEVFMFTHHTTKILSQFIRISVSSGASLALSPSHYVPVSGHFKAARAIVPGDEVTLASGARDVVVQVQKENLWGLHNPQTVDGTIIVDGILASTYTESVRPVTAVALLAPVKFLYSLGFRSIVLESTFARGNSLWAGLLPSGRVVW